MDTVEEFTRDKERLWKLSSPELKRMVERRPGEAVEHYECYEERGPDEEFERRWGNSFPVYTTDPSINLQTIDLANMRIGGLGFKKADICKYLLSAWMSPNLTQRLNFKHSRNERTDSARTTSRAREWREWASPPRETHKRSTNWSKYAEYFCCRCCCFFEDHIPFEHFYLLEQHALEHCDNSSSSQAIEIWASKMTRRSQNGGSSVLDMFSVDSCVVERSIWILTMPSGLFWMMLNHVATFVLSLAWLEGQSKFMYTNSRTF